MASMMAWCSGSDTCVRPGRSDSWNWCRTIWALSRWSRPAATVWPEISCTAWCSSRLSAEYLSGSPAATAAASCSPIAVSCPIWAGVATSAALAAHSPSSTIRHSVMAIASATGTARTRAPRFGMRSTRPSADRSIRAARTLARVVPSSSASSASTSRWPGTTSPFMTAPAQVLHHEPPGLVPFPRAAAGGPRAPAGPLPRDAGLRFASRTNPICLLRHSGLPSPPQIAR